MNIQDGEVMKWLGKLISVLIHTHKQYYVFMSRLVNVLSLDFVVPVSCVRLIELPQKFMFLILMGKREFPIIGRHLLDHKPMI